MMSILVVTSSIKTQSLKPAVFFSVCACVVVVVIASMQGASFIGGHRVVFAGGKTGWV